eukprot:g65357.t1
MLLCESATCSTTAQSQAAGTTKRWHGPANCAGDSGTVWGLRDNNYYTDNTVICKAAVHQGVITNAGSGSKVAVTKGSASSWSNYCWATYNGVATNSYLAPWTPISLSQVCPSNFPYLCTGAFNSAACFASQASGNNCNSNCGGCFHDGWQRYPKRTRKEWSQLSACDLATILVNTEMLQRKLMAEAPHCKAVVHFPGQSNKAILNYILFSRPGLGMGGSSGLSDVNVML